MANLQALLIDRPTFTLDQLSDTANEHLARLSTGRPVDARVAREVSPRLVRHYVSEGLLDPAMREGRRVVYGVDHLLQLLALRRLLADGLATNAIGPLLKRMDHGTLLSVAEGDDYSTVPTSFAPLADAGTPEGASFEGARPDDDPRERLLQAPPDDLRRAPPGPDEEAARRRARARAAVADIRSRHQGKRSPSLADHFSPSVPPRSLRPPVPAAGAADPVTWERVPLLDGVELHVRSDLQIPDDPVAQRHLLDHVVRSIVLYAQRRHR